jgi:hypothetical protein
VIALEAWTRPLSLLHAVTAATLVGGATHHLLWCLGYRRGRWQRVQAERRLAAWNAALFLGAFLCGALLYPTYKVRVRVEYLDSPSAVTAEAELRRAHQAEPAPVAGGGGGLAWVGRLFDVKEHWAALGAAAALALFALSRLAHPRERPEVLVLYLGLSALVCATAWTAGIVGLLVMSYRSVGGVG